MNYFTNIHDEVVTWCHAGVDPPPSTLGYGLLYNWYAASNPLIAPIGWHVPSDDEWKTFEIAIGMSPADADLMNLRGTTEGGELKEIGLTHWNTPNTGATNEWGFGVRGTGTRTYVGGFAMIKQYGALWTSTTGTGGMSALALERQFNNDGSQINRNYGMKFYGHGIRALKNDSTNPGTVTDYDGNIYNCIKVGSQVWTDQNLIVKHLNDGTVIPEVTDGPTWPGLVTGAWCYYNNDPLNI